MKRTSVLLNVVVYLLFAFSSFTLNAQCASPLSLGSSANMLTKAKNNANVVAADKDLNTVIFIHRNNPATFGGSSGQLRFDISTNGGTTWSNNQGPLNPLMTKQARYPDIALYNPAGNTNPANAYLTYLAPTINSSGGWSGVVSGVQKLNGTGTTEAYTQPGPANQILGSLVKGAPGVFWAADLAYNGSQITGGILVYKGTWNGSTVNWSLNQQFNPSYNLSMSGNPFLGEVSIAFDPSGMKGWLCATAHLSSAGSYYRYLPVFYKTTDGGNSWSGPMVVDISQFSCISGNTNTGTPALHYANDLTVDLYGNPHLITTVGVGDNAYSISSTQWHHMYDITQQRGVWTAYDLANVKAEVSTVFPGSAGSYVYQITHPQISRSADGTKVFFGWSDNSSYVLGNPNMSPQFFAKGFDVIQNKWTQVRDFTSCSGAVSGEILFPHMAAEVLEPASGQYKLAVVYGDMSNGDPDDIASFRFLDNVLFDNVDFTISQTLLNPLSISPGSLVPICAGTSANLQVSGSFQEIAWSNGVSSSSNSVNTPGVYYVGVRQGCVVGWDSITVSTLSMSLPAASLSTCEGTAQNLSVNGNALGYTWTPGQLSGTSVTVTPASSTVYTVTGAGINTCMVSSTLSLTVKPAPSLSVSSSNSMACIGDEVILQAAGADTFTWSSGALTATAAVYPLANTVYTVTGINSAGCKASFTMTQSVDACAGIVEAGFNRSQLLVYPNPGTGVVHIQSTTDLRCHLTNELGQTLRLLELNAGNGRLITVDDLAPGLYFLTAGSDKAYLHYKIVVQR